ncbi:hypothetical protein KSS87_014941 [Heliosperma pusillum]|nr:hypothetical protein KSS87_014941 [Heliosperma pusillum]
MASENAIEPPTSTSDMELESTVVENESESGVKREREEEIENGNENDVVSKKQKVENGEEEEEEKSVEEVRMETVVEEEDEDEKVGPVNLGPKTFGTSIEMFDYFYKLLHHWPISLHANKYEYMVLLDLIKKGHPEPDKKIGSGITAFEIQYHPTWESRCFFVVRGDKSVEDFSFRKCVDQILPLPENMKIKTDVNEALGGNAHGKNGGEGGRGGGRGGGRSGGRGRGWGRGGRSKR